MSINSLDTLDLIDTAALLLATVLVVLLYGGRILARGRARFARVDRQGGSALLGSGAMEMAYWGLQPVGRLILRLRITPNMLTWASLGFGLLVALFLAAGHFGIGAMLATISAFLDTLDGMVARLTGVASDAGEVLDASVDRYVEFAFLGGLAFYYRAFPALLVLSLLALAGSFMISYSTAKAEALHLPPPRGIMRRPERALYLTLGAVLSGISIPAWEIHHRAHHPIGYPMVAALGLVAVMSNVSAVRRLRRIAALARETATAH